MTNEIAKAYTEIDKILSIMPDEYTQRIPLKLREKFKKEKDFSYNFEINDEKHLNQQGLSNKSLALLAMIKYNYWCDSEEERKKLALMFKENEDKYQEKLREKYNPDNLFKNNKVQNKKEIVLEEKALIKVNNENFLQKIIKKILNFIVKRKN